MERIEKGKMSTNHVICKTTYSHPDFFQTTLVFIHTRLLLLMPLSLKKFTITPQLTLFLYAFKNYIPS